LTRLSRSPYPRFLPPAYVTPTRRAARSVIRQPPQLGQRARVRLPFREALDYPYSPGDGSPDAKERGYIMNDEVRAKTLAAWKEWFNANIVAK
jgi:hypothetical protein